MYMEMDQNAENKIGLLIEGFKINPKVLKTAGLAGLGGMVGAGLDLYTGNAAAAIGDFARPMAAWGLGGAIGAMGLAKSTKEEIADMKKELKLKEELHRMQKMKETQNLNNKELKNVR